QSLAERHEVARQGRGVCVVPGDDGMADLVATLPAVIAHGIHDRLSQMAHRVKTANARRASADTVGDDPVDERGVDVLRADLLAEMLLTAVPEGHDDAELGLDAIRARVEVTVPALTLMGDHGTVPAELSGYGPIDADT